jgi:hypothetical protein
VGKDKETGLAGLVFYGKRISYKAGVFPQVEAGFSRKEDYLEK